MPEMKPQLRERLKSILSMQGWCTYGKAHHLAQLVLEHKPDIVIDIGVYGGRTTAAFAMACQALYNGQVHAIDPWSNAAALEGGTSKEDDEWWAKLDLEQIRKTYLSNIQQLGLEDWITTHHMHDADALAQFHDKSVGVIQNDSNHSASVSVRTCRDWVPKLKIGGLMIVDDSHWPSLAEAIALMHDGLGTRHLSTHDMFDEDGKPAGQYMVFERVY